MHLVVWDDRSGLDLQHCFVLIPWLSKEQLGKWKYWVLVHPPNLLVVVCAGTSAGRLAAVWGNIGNNNTNNTCLFK